MIFLHLDFGWTYHLADKKPGVEHALLLDVDDHGIILVVVTGYKHAKEIFVAAAVLVTDDLVVLGFARMILAPAAAKKKQVV